MFSLWASHVKQVLTEAEIREPEGKEPVQSLETLPHQKKKNKKTNKVIVKILKWCLATRIYQTENRHTLTKACLPQTPQLGLPCQAHLVFSDKTIFSGESWND